MAKIDNESLNSAAQKVIGSQLPTEANVLARLNELDTPQSARIDGIAKHLSMRGMDPIAAEHFALGVGLGMLLMVEADK